MSLQGTIKGLQNIKSKSAEKNSGGGDGESPFLTLKDKEAARVRFLQEFEEGAPGHDDRRGTITVVEEHVHPVNYRKRAVCTMEAENRCWGCEQTSDPDVGKKWKPKMRFYANVIVRGEEGDKVKILAQGFSDKHIGTNLLEQAEEFGTLTDRDMKVTRKGASATDTSYSFLPLANKPLSEGDLKHEVIDLSKFIKYVPYSEQEDFFNSTASEGGEKSAKDW